MLQNKVPLTVQISPFETEAEAPNHEAHELTRWSEPKRVADVCEEAKRVEEDRKAYTEERTASTSRRGCRFLQ